MYTLQHQIINGNKAQDCKCIKLRTILTLAALTASMITTTTDCCDIIQAKQQILYTHVPSKGSTTNTSSDITSTTHCGSVLPSPLSGYGPVSCVPDSLHTYFSRYVFLFRDLPFAVSVLSLTAYTCI